jgi:hypothetical protein
MLAERSMGQLSWMLSDPNVTTADLEEAAWDLAYGDGMLAASWEARNPANNEESSRGGDLKREMYEKKVNESAFDIEALIFSGTNQ